MRVAEWVGGHDYVFLCMRWVRGGWMDYEACMIRAGMLLGKREKGGERKRGE